MTRSGYPVCLLALALPPLSTVVPGLMHYDLGFFDPETTRLGIAENPFGAKVLPMSPV